MTISRGLLLALLLLGTSGAARADDGALAARFAAEIKCEPGARDLQRGWCAVTKIGKAPFAAPTTATTYLGLSMELRDGAKVAPSLLDTTQPAALHVGPSGVRLTSLKPSNEEEKKEMLALVFAIAKALKDGASDPLPASAGLKGYLDGERKKTAYAVKPSGEYQGKLPSRIYKSGNVFVVVEQGTGGVFVNVFPAIPLNH